MNLNALRARVRETWDRVPLSEITREAGVPYWKVYNLATGKRAILSGEEAERVAGACTDGIRVPALPELRQQLEAYRARERSGGRPLSLRLIARRSGVSQSALSHFLGRRQRALNVTNRERLARLVSGNAPVSERSLIKKPPQPSPPPLTRSAQIQSIITRMEMAVAEAEKARALAAAKTQEAEEALAALSKILRGTREGPNGG